jgi:hypothetical protein
VARDLAILSRKRIQRFGGWVDGVASAVSLFVVSDGQLFKQLRAGPTGNAIPLPSRNRGTDVDREGTAVVKRAISFFPTQLEHRQLGFYSPTDLIR